MSSVNERALAVLGNPDWSPNWALDGLSFYGELMHPETGMVWLCQQSFTAQQYQALQPPEGFIKSGMGRASHDAAFFRRSPGEPADGPLETMTVGDRIFARVARPGTFEPGFEGVMVLPVYKYHCVMFAAGRTLEIMSFGDGWDYVPQIVDVESPLPGMVLQDERILPEGWSVRELTLKEDLFVELPYPARVCFFMSGHSFQGPVKLGLD